MIKTEAIVSSSSWCSRFYFYLPPPPLLCLPLFISLNSEVRDRNPISPHHLSICKIERSLSSEIRWNSDGVVEFWTSVCVCVWEWFLYYEGTRGLPGRKRSAQLQAFDVCIIYSSGTHWDVGDSIFAEWGNGLPQDSLTSRQRWGL